MCQDSHLVEIKAPRSGEPNECLGLTQYATGMWQSGIHQLYITSLQKCLASDFFETFYVNLVEF